MIKRLLYRGYRRLAANKLWLYRRFSKSGLMVLGGLVATAALGVDTTLVVAYQAFCLLLLLLATALICNYFTRPRFSLQRLLPRFGSVGVPITYRLTVRNLSRRWQRGVAFYEMLDDPRPTLEEFLTLPEPGEERRNWWDRKFAYYRWSWLIQRRLGAKIVEQPLGDLPPSGELTLTVPLLPLRRGALQLKGGILACPDPFGLTRALVRVTFPQSILILPKRYRLPLIKLPGSLRYQQGGVALAASVGEAEEFVSLRDYRQGDPLRNIHWKSWARTGKPIIKEFEEEFFVRHALILDTFCDQEASPAFEEAVSVAASFACTLQSQESLLDLMFVGTQAYCFTAGRGLGQADQMLEILASVGPCRGQGIQSLQHLVQSHAASVSGCICILLAWDQERKTLVEQLQTRGVPVLVLVITDVLPPKAATPSPWLHFLVVDRIEEGLARL